MTEGDAIRAITTLARMKAVESAPDAQGHRQIWHHSPTGAELVSVVDETGRLRRQELTLFTDFIQWQHGARIRTGEIPSRGDMLTPPTAGQVHFDLKPELDRIRRVRAAFEGYEGAERYVQHMKRMVDSARATGLSAAVIITRLARDVTGARVRLGKRSGAGVNVRVVAIAALALAGLALLVFARIRS